MAWDNAGAVHDFLSSHTFTISDLAGSRSARGHSRLAKSHHLLDPADRRLRHPIAACVPFSVVDRMIDFDVLRETLVVLVEGLDLESSRRIDWYGIPAPLDR